MTNYIILLTGINIIFIEYIIFEIRAIGRTAWAGD